MSGQSIIPGQAEGAVLASAEGLSFWGGVDPLTGIVIDAHHPLCGQSIAACIFSRYDTRVNGGNGMNIRLEVTPNKRRTMP